MLEIISEKTNLIDAEMNYESDRFHTDKVAFQALKSTELTLKYVGLEPEFIEDDDETIVRSYN